MIIIRDFFLVMIDLIIKTSIGVV